MHSSPAATLDRLILESVQEANILPITSRCGCGCVFCSHKNNPPGVAVHSVGVRSLDQIARTLAFLDPDRVITIGESATTIIEGEPFSHPAFTDIVALVRRAFPRTPVEITTNGSYLTADVVESLRGMGDVSLHVSLNSASERGRRLLMGEGPEPARRAIEGVRLLARVGFRFSGSLVALPHLVGWDDIRSTVEFLAADGAEAVRVIAPAFSSLANPGLIEATRGLYPELRRFVEALPDALPCPVLLEPSCVADLTPVVSGVVAGSPAQQAEVRRGDVLLSIDGRVPRCRVEAWQWLLREGPVRVELERGAEDLDVCWHNPGEGGAGVTVAYDFDPARMDRLGEAIAACMGPSLVLTSELGHAVVARVLESLGPLGSLGGGSGAVRVAAVKNLTFGGTIGAAGLLTVDDYLAAHAVLLEAGADGAEPPAQILVPQESFDGNGFDLTRCHFSRLEQVTGSKVRVL